MGQIDERTMAETGVDGAGPIKEAETVKPGVSDDAGPAPATETATSENSKPGPVVTETATPEHIAPAPSSPTGSDMSGFSQEEVAKAEENVAIHKENSQEEILQILRSLQTDVAEIKVGQNKMKGDVKSISDNYTALKNQLGEFQKSLDFAHGEIKDLKRDFKGHTQAIEKLNNDKVLQDNTLVEFNSRLRKAETAITQLTSDKGSLQEQVALLSQSRTKEFPIDKTIIVRNVPCEEGENVVELAHNLISVVLGLDLEIVRVKRKGASYNRDGILKIEFNSNDDVREVLRYKSSLRFHSNPIVRRFFIRQSQSDEYRMCDRKVDLLAKQMNKRFNERGNLVDTYQGYSNSENDPQRLWLYRPYQGSSYPNQHLRFNDSDDEEYPPEYNPEARPWWESVPGGRGRGQRGRGRGRGIYARGRGTAMPFGRGSSIFAGRGTAMPSGRGTATPSGPGTTMPAGRGTDMPSNRGTAMPSGRGTARRDMSPGDAVRSPGRNDARQPDDGTGVRQPPGEDERSRGRNDIRRPDDGTGQDEWSPGRDNVRRPDGEMRPPGGVERSPSRTDGPPSHGARGSGRGRDNSPRPGSSGLSGQNTHGRGQVDGSRGRGRGDLPHTVNNTPTGNNGHNSSFHSPEYY